MPLIDSLQILGFAEIATDVASTDGAIIDIPSRGSGNVILYVTVYGATGDNTLTTFGVFGAAAGAGAAIVANAALGATHAASTGVTQRTVAATALTPIVTADKVYLRVGTASGVANSKVKVAIVGYNLP